MSILHEIPAARDDKLTGKTPPLIPTLGTVIGVVTIVDRFVADTAREFVLIPEWTSNTPTLSVGSGALAVFQSMPCVVSVGRIWSSKQSHTLGPAADVSTKHPRSTHIAKTLFSSNVSVVECAGPKSTSVDRSVSSRPSWRRPYAFQTNRLWPAAFFLIQRVIW